MGCILHPLVMLKDKKLLSTKHVAVLSHDHMSKCSVLIDMSYVGRKISLKSYYATKGIENALQDPLSLQRFVTMTPYPIKVLGEKRERQSRPLPV